MRRKDEPADTMKSIQMIQLAILLQWEHCFLFHKVIELMHENMIKVQMINFMFFLFFNYISTSVMNRSNRHILSLGTKDKN